MRAGRRDQYLEAGLVDLMHLVVTTVLLGAGEALLAGIDLPALGYRRSAAAPRTPGEPFPREGAGEGLCLAP